MGRSVSYPSGALVAYAATPSDEDWCSNCGETIADCGCDEEDQEVVAGGCDWEWVTEDLITRAKRLFPSLRPNGGWRGREDQILASNGFVDFGVSEYCGLMAIWLVPQEGLEGNLSPLAERWIDKAAATFLEEFGEYRKLGTASNGESFYRRIK